MSTKNKSSHFFHPCQEKYQFSLDICFRKPVHPVSFFRLHIRVCHRFRRRRRRCLRRRRRLLQIDVCPPSIPDAFHVSMFHPNTMKMMDWTQFQADA
jgi:hypothetical protein